MTTHGLTRKQVLIHLKRINKVMNSTSDAVNICNGGLKEVRSSLKVESVRNASNGLFLATNEVASSSDVLFK